MKGVRTEEARFDTGKSQTPCRFHRVSANPEQSSERAFSTLVILGGRTGALKPTLLRHWVWVGLRRARTRKWPFAAAHIRR